MMSTNSLVQYESACRTLADARSVDEVKNIHDEATAIAAYARIAKNHQLEADAVEIRKRAGRRLGEMMAAQPKAKPPGTNQHRKVDRGIKNPEAPATLNEACIDKNLAKRARAMAALPPAEFERDVMEARDNAGPRRSRSKSKKASERVGFGDDMPVADAEFTDESRPDPNAGRSPEPPAKLPSAELFDGVKACLAVVDRLNAWPDTPKARQVGKALRSALLDAYDISSRKPSISLQIV
jgi:hypothetical protein